MACLVRVAALAAVLAGCAADPHQVRLVVRAEDATLDARIAWVEVRILEGGCDGEVVYAEGFRPTRTASAPPRLGAGTYGFEARANDASCNQIAFVCDAIPLPRDGTIELVLAATAPSSACPTGTCDEGACTGCDGGTCAPACDGGVCPPACDGGVCPPVCDGGVCPGACGEYPESACPSCEPTAWSIGVADDTPSRGASPSVAKDPAGGLHATWADTSSEGGIVYAYHTPDPYWIHATLDAEGAAGMYADVEVDADGGVHVAYLEENADDILYAYKAPGSDAWSRATVDAEGQLGGGISLAVDPGGTVHVLYRDAGTFQLRYARGPAGGPFTPETIVPPVPSRVLPSAMDVDARGVAHVLFRSDRSSAIQYASRTPEGAWSFEDVPPLDADNDTGLGLEVAVEPDGRLHAVFHMEVDRGLGYAQRAPDGTWSTYLVSADSRVRMELGVDVGPTGDLHVTYQYDDRRTLQYVRRDPSGGWTAPIQVGTVENAARYSSVAADSAGGVHVAFSQDNERDLYYAHRDAGGAWTVSALAHIGNVGAHAAIAVDDNGLVHIAHQEELTDDLLIACGSVRGFWQAERIPDPAARAGAFSSVVAGAASDVHVIYQDGATEEVRAAHRVAGGEWTIETVDPGPSAGQSGALALAADGALHALYLVDGIIRHAVRGPTGAWSLDDLGTERADWVAIAASADGTIHAAYHTLADEPRYARWSSGGWLLSTLYPADTQTRIAIAVASDGTVHAAFAVEAGFDLAHTTLAPGAPLDSWAPPTIVDPDSEEGEHLALALDASGRPHIAYSHGTPIIDGYSGARTGTRYDLRYATLEGDAFVTEVLATQGDIGQHLAIVADTARVHVLFPDPFRRVLHATNGLAR